MSGQAKKPVATNRPATGQRGTPAGSAPPGRRRQGANKKLANGLVALSSAAVLTVYAVGYARTEPAAASVASYQIPATVANTPTATATTPPTSTSAPAAASGNVPASQRRSEPGRYSVSSTLPPPTPTTAPPATATSPATTAAFRDGTYVGTGTSRHGSIEATVVVQGGRIVSADVTGCGTRYPCSAVAPLTSEVVSRQSASIDFVSGATDSSMAYRMAVATALAQAR